MLEFMSVKLWHKLDQWLDETSRPLPAGQKSIQPQDGRQQLYYLQVCQFHVMSCCVMLTKFTCKIANSGDYTFPYIPHLSYILHVTFSVGYCPIT